MDPLNLILLAIAVIVAWRLWSVLGSRTGLEKPPIVLTPQSNEVNRPTPVEVPSEGDVMAPEPSRPVWEGVATEGSTLAIGLESIASRTKGFDVPSFVRGAGVAYEMVLEAFAKADKPTLKPLLSKELYESFAREIDARAAKGQNQQFQFVGVKSAEIKQATLQGNRAQLDVAFAADMISATLDKAGTVVDGDTQAIRTVTDLWTFERDVTARDPNWKLIATDDNV